MNGPDEILDYWLDDVGPQGWFDADEAMDAAIRDRFEETWVGAMDGRFSLWLTYPSGTLAYVILTDQLSRNMFRGTEKAFASDRLALAAAKQAIHKGWDLKIDEPGRWCFYLPMMHSENLCDQERCVRLIHERMPENGPVALPHAKAHREVIRQFGRFPYRNAALGRESNSAEKAYLVSGGYAETLRMLDAKKAS